jgi:hypothetical protein
MISVTPLSQRDPRWKNEKLGTSNETIGNKGCTISCLSMCIASQGLNYTPSGMSKQLVQVKGFLNGNLLLWGRINAAFPKFKAYRYPTYDNAKALESLSKGMPVLVEVNAAKIGAPKHWILFIGDKKAVDPWTGTIIPTSTYPLTGMAIITKV